MRGIGWIFGRDGDAAFDAIEELRRRILRAAVQATGLGVAAMAIYAVAVANPVAVAAYLSGVAETFGVFVLVGGAAFLSAALLGFLFGVPKTLQGTVQGRETAYKINTSFEEISDWLTKMIIGVGLVELKSIPSALMTLNDYVAWAVPQPGSAPVIGATVVFFTAAGLLVGYLATRLYISRAFKDADEELNRLKDAVRNAAPALDSLDPRAGGAAGGNAPNPPGAGPGPAPAEATTRADRGDTAKPPEANDPRVQKLVEEAESANVDPRTLDRVAARRIALAYYFNDRYDSALPYFERAGAEDMSDEGLALQYAISLGESGQRTRAANFLRTMVERGKGVPAAYKLLGYFMLWLPEQLLKGANYTEEYLHEVPNDAGAIFNLACAYAQLYGQHRDEAVGSEYREKALEALKKAISLDRLHWQRRARELRIADFWALKDEDEFRKLVDG